MKKLYTLLLLWISVAVPSLTTFGQALPPLQPEQDACNALQLCGTTFTTPYSYSGYGQVQEQTQFGTNAGCFSESNSVWLHVKVIAAGTIVFAIHPADSTNDYDFAVYDISNGGNCATIATNGNRIRCNGNTILPIGTIPGGIIGLNMTSTFTVVPAGTTGDPFCQYIAAPVGGEYLIMIDNFSASASGFTIDFSGSTAVFDQGVPPALGSIVPSCSKNEKINITLTKPVKCNSIATDGSDFFLTPSGTIATATGLNCTPNGYTSQIQISFAAPLTAGNYVLNTKVGTDGNTLIDLCGNALLPPDTLQFTVAPANNPDMIKLDTPACYGAKVVLAHKVLCSTIAGNGSDFKITGPGVVNVVHAYGANCNVNGLADTVNLLFDGSIKTPGTYTLSVVKGTDGDKVVDSCGYSVSNTISWVVSDKGFIDATATPNLLCKPGYTTLNGTPLIAPPLEQVNCGTNGTQCSTPSNPFMVGDGSAAGAILNTPFYGGATDARTQMLFTAGQLHAAGINAGTITQLALNVTYKSSTDPYSGFTIRMKCTNVSALTDFVPGTQVVYTPKSYSSVSGINTFVLDNPYDWDGNSNLIVEICFHNTDYTNSDYVQTTPGVSPGVVLHIHDYYSNPGCDLVSDTAFYPPSADRPNITFTQCMPPSAGYGTQWTPGTYVGDTTAFNTVAYVPSTRIYTIQIMDTNRCYRRDTAKVTISVRHPLLMPENDTAICYGQNIQLQASGGDTYFWYPSTGLSCTTCSDPVAAPLINTTYHVVITDQYGCSDTLSKTIVVHPLPIIYAGMDTSIIYGESIQLQATAPSGLYFLWDPVTGLSNPNILDPVASPEVTTKYALLVIDSNTCRQMDTVKVTVRTNVPILIPTAFTPDGDGRNDVFHVVNFSFQRIAEFRVFNRWGQEVFSADNNNGWDGTYKGKAQETGVYNYIIRIAWPDGNVTTYKGDVTLVR